VARLDSDVTWVRALDGSEYMPGLVGLNNMKANDYANVVVQVLSRVTPIRCVRLWLRLRVRVGGWVGVRVGGWVSVGVGRRGVCSGVCGGGCVAAHTPGKGVAANSTGR
jgi:hypothetical protein